MLLPHRVPAACANWPSKPAWEWTTRERIEHRFDAVCTEARRLQAAVDDPDRGDCKGSGSPDFVFGTDTPELYLPFELFQEFKSATLEHARERADRVAAEIGLPHDYREKIAAILSRATANSDLEKCHERPVLLDAIRNAFPPGLFDRFLYETQAPGLCMSGSTDAVQTTFIANGCR